MSLYGDTELTEKELEIVYLARFGLKNKQIADEFGTTEHVIKNYFRTIYDKLGMDSRAEITLWFFEHEYLYTPFLYDEST